MEVVQPNSQGKSKHKSRKRKGLDVQQTEDTASNKREKPSPEVTKVLKQFTKWIQTHYEPAAHLLHIEEGVNVSSLLKQFESSIKDMLPSNQSWIKNAISCSYNSQIRYFNNGVTTNLQLKSVYTRCIDLWTQDKETFFKFITNPQTRKLLNYDQLESLVWILIQKYGATRSEFNKADIYIIVQWLHNSEETSIIEQRLFVEELLSKELKVPELTPSFNTQKIVNRSKPPQDINDKYSKGSLAAKELLKWFSTVSGARPLQLARHLPFGNHRSGAVNFTEQNMVPFIIAAYGTVDYFISCLQETETGKSIFKTQQKIQKEAITAGFVKDLEEGCSSFRKIGSV